MSTQPAVDRTSVEIDGKQVDPKKSGLNLDQGPLVPAGAVVVKPITVKSELVGMVVVGSLDDILNQINK